MAFDLLALLQAADRANTDGTLVAYPQNQQPSSEDTPIVVQGTRNKPTGSHRVSFPSAPDAPVLTNGPDAPDFGNRSYVEAARAALKNVPPNKGMFGVKGTLRDVLGTLGDAFLVQAGRNPVYRLQRDKEQAQDALTGLTANPLAAVERLSQTDPDAAQKLYNQVVQNDLEAQQRQAAILQLQRQTDKDTDERYQQYGRLFSQFAGSASPETYDRLKPILNTLKRRGGLGSEYQVPDTYDENLMSSYQQGGMPAQQQVYADFRDRRLAQQNDLEHMKEEGRMKRDHPPQGRPAPQPTTASMAAPLINKVLKGQPLTPGEQQALDRLGYSPNRGQGRRGRAAGGTGAPSPKYVVRNGQLVPAQ